MWASNKSLLLLILFSVSCSSVAQLFLKLGMVNRSHGKALAAGDWPAMLVGALLNPMVIGGLALYFFGALVWLIVLAKVDLSFAYPFVGLGFIITLVLGKLVMDEAITPQRLLGTLLVAAGVIMVAASGKPQV